MAASGLSARTVARRAGLDWSLVYQLARGQARKSGVTLRTVLLLAPALDVSPAWLAFGEGPGPSSASLA